MQHLISVDDLQISEIENIFTLADQSYIEYHAPDKKALLLFFENSTRTSLSFKIAAAELGIRSWDLNIQTSSVKKGESFIDTINTVLSMKIDFLIIRHDKSGICNIAKECIKGNDVTLINAGDGTNEHPTQALIDLFTIKKNYNINGIKIAICGDILHSRVAHSNIKLFEKFNMEVLLVAPPNLLPNINIKNKIFYDINEVIDEIDVLILLRLQKERIQNYFLPSKEEYYNLYGLDKIKMKKCKNKKLFIMHPGPINRGTEIDPDILDATAINMQVTNGIAVRKAIFMHYLEKNAQNI